MISELSPYRLAKARKIYNSYNVLNATSWGLLVGSIITLFALRLEASATFIGIISSAFYIALFLLPLGKFFIKRFSIIGVFSFAWIARSICMIIVVAAPFAEAFGRRDIALQLLLLGVFAFHFFRGIGLVSNNPILSLLSTGADKASYLTQVQITFSGFVMLGGFLIAVLFRGDPSIFLYSAVMVVGIVTGVASGVIVKKVPEPPVEQAALGAGIFSVFKEALSQENIRRFLFIFFLIALVSGAARAFVIVYAREVFAQSDSMIFLYTVLGSLGHLLIGLSVKFLVDRLGAKPLFIVCVIIGLASMVSVIVFPAGMTDSARAAGIFLSILFFLLSFGFLGSEGIAQTYFIALVPEKKILDMSIIYFMILGLAGACGLFLSGLFLDALIAFGVSPFVSFKIFFGFMILLTSCALAMQRKLKSLGSHSFKGTLEVIFSMRDLRAISLLDKLSKTDSSREEENIVRELYSTSSGMAAKGLLERARSPRLLMRQESIRALGRMPALDESVQNALMQDMKNNPFTTAHISARALGRHRCKAAIPLLREMAFSDDYMLAGEAMLALAGLKDDEFRPEIERLVLGSENPRIKIMGSEALGLYGNPNSLSVLLEILRGTDPPPYLRDEVILGMSGILGTDRLFYPVLIKFAANNSLAATLASDETEAAFEFYVSESKKKKGGKKIAAGDAGDINAGGLKGAVFEYMQNKNGTELSRWIMGLPGESETIIRTILPEAVLDEELSAHDCLRLLISHWAACKLRAFAKG
ncbi:MAG: MFS transporter [Spirochaetes bacterium]|nr:MFS transporter [Spirochaetota bacterium]